MICYRWRPVGGGGTVVTVRGEVPEHVSYLVDSDGACPAGRSHE